MCHSHFLNKKVYNIFFLKSKTEFQMRAASEIIDHVLPFPIPFLFQSIPCTYIQLCQPINRDSIRVFCCYYLILTELKSTICVPPKLLLTLCPHWEIFKTHVSIHTLALLDPTSCASSHHHLYSRITSRLFLLSLALIP